MNNHQCQVRYSRATVETFLPAVWDEDFILKPPKNNVPLGVRIKSRPEALNDWQLGVADVTLAFYRAGLSLDEKEVLGLLNEGQSYASTAAIFYLQVADIQALEESALTKIIHWLNGKR